MPYISLSPAHAGSWIKCPAWAATPYDSSNGNNRYEGLALHDVAAHALSNPGSQMLDYEGSVQLVKGEQVVITLEMLSRVKIYIDYVRSLGGDRYVEGKVTCPTIHEKCKGVVDSWIYFPEEHHLIVTDYKDGRREVPVFENHQLICYAAGLIYQYFRDREGNLKITMVIVQPRSRETDKIKKWTVSAPYLRTYVNKLSNVAHNRLSSTPKSHAGEHCRYCNKKTTCKAYNITLENLIHACDYADQLYDQGERLRLLNLASKIISMSLDAEEAQALSDIKAGKSVNGYTTTHGRGSWVIKDKKELESLAQLFGVDPYKPVSMKTPTQLKNEGIPQDMLEPFTERFSGKLKLAPINQDDVRKIFGDNNG